MDVRDSGAGVAGKASDSAAGGEVPAAAPDDARAALVDRLEDEIAAASAHADAAMHRLLTLVRAFDAADGWGLRGAKSPAHWLAYRTRIGMVAARERVRVARALGAFPATDEAMREGRLSYSQARAITRVMTPENEQQLLEYARTLSGSRLQKVCNSMRRVMVPQRRVQADDDDRWVRTQYTDDGFFHADIRLFAEEGPVVMKALDNIVRKMRDLRRKAKAAAVAPAQPESGGSAAPDPGMAVGEAEEASRCAVASCGVALAALAADASACTWSPGGCRTQSEPAAQGCCDPSREGHCSKPRWQRHHPADETPLFNRADALVALSESVLANPELFQLGGIPGLEMVVQVQRDTLCGKSNEPALLPDGMPIPSETARRLACDTTFYVVETDEEGHVLDVGRKTRLIHSPLRRALQLRDKGCRFPGCTEQAWVDGHHIQPWAEGGETSLSNLALLCRRHHVLVHEGGFSARIEAGELRFYDPRGRYLPPVCEIADPCPAASLDAWLEASGLKDRRTPVPEWYGSRRDWPLTADARGDETLPRKRGPDGPS